MKSFIESFYFSFGHGDTVSSMEQSSSPTYRMARTKEDTQSTMGLAGSFTEATASMSNMTQGVPQTAVVTSTEALIHNQTSLDDTTSEITMEALVPILTVVSDSATASPTASRNVKTSEQRSMSHSPARSPRQSPTQLGPVPEENKKTEVKKDSEVISIQNTQDQEDLTFPGDTEGSDKSMDVQDSDSSNKPDLVAACDNKE